MTHAAFPAIGCLVMAAGSAERFGTDKLSAALGGRTLIERALSCVPNALFARLVVVTQYPGVEAVSRAHGFEPVRNDRPELGVSRTIRLGTEAMRECDAILYMVADQPLLTRTTVSRVVETWRKNTGKIVGASARGVRGNPNIFPARFFPELLRLTGDCGGAQVIRRHPEAFLPVETPPEELLDCDTPEALRALERKKPNGAP